MFLQRLQDDLESLSLKIKQHEDNIKSLKAQKNMLDDSILDKEGMLSESDACSVNTYYTLETFLNGG